MGDHPVPPYVRELVLDLVTLFLVQVHEHSAGVDEELGPTNTARQCPRCDEPLAKDWKRCPFCID